MIVWYNAVEDEAFSTGAAELNLLKVKPCNAFLAQALSDMDRSVKVFTYFHSGVRADQWPEAS